MSPPTPNCRFYASAIAVDGVEMFTDVFSHPMGVRMCGVPDREIRPVSVREARPGEDSPYWGWLDAKEGEYSIIWPSRIQFDMCFPYGPEAEEKAGKGRIVNLVVEPRAEDTTPAARPPDATFPLRAIVSRRPHPERPDIHCFPPALRSAMARRDPSTWPTSRYLETLECGHLRDVTIPDLPELVAKGKAPKRRRCPHCAQKSPNA